MHHQAEEVFHARLNGRRFDDAKGPGNGFERRQSLGVALSSDSPSGAGPLGKPDHFGVFESRKPSSHSGGLAPVAVRNHKGDGPAVPVQKTPGEDRDVFAGIEKEGSPFGNVEIAEIKGTILMAVNAQLTIGERFKGKRTGRRGLSVLATMHHEDEPGIKGIPGDRPADAQLNMHPASSATFAFF